MDSSEFHKDAVSELKYTFSGFIPLLKQMILSKHAILLITWALLYKICLAREVGTIYFLFTSIAFVCLNLGKREKNSMSAYSIFNKGFKSLPGEFSIKNVESLFGI